MWRQGERGIRKLYVTSVEHNAALRAFPKALCALTHTAYTARKVVCSPKVSVLKRRKLMF